MDARFKSDLKRLVNDYAARGRGPFGQWALERGDYAPALTNRQLADGLIQSYGPALIAQLRRAKLARFYELDVASVVGPKRSQIILGTMHQRLEAPKMVDTEIRTSHSTKAAFGALVVATALVAALHFLGPKPEDNVGASGIVASDGRLLSFPDCKSYLSGQASLQCLNAFTGGQVGEEHPGVATASALSRSRWADNSQCTVWTTLTYADTYSEAVRSLASSGVLSNPFGASKSSAIAAACLQASNHAADAICSEAPGGCPK